MIWVNFKITMKNKTMKNNKVDNNEIKITLLCCLEPYADCMWWL